MAGAGATPGSGVSSAFTSVLRADLASEPGAAALRALGATNNASAEPGVTLSVANSLWARASVRESYQHTLSQRFSACAAPLKGAALINAWVSNATAGHISNLISDDVADDPLTVALLVNAVYFKAPWATPFDAARTEKAVFRAHAADGGGAEAEEVACMMMSHKPRQTLFARTDAGTVRKKNAIFAMHFFAMRCA
jgi:serine protease inhibitor